MELALAPVIANEPAGAGVHILRLQSEAIARYARPGQFVHIRCVETDGLGIPGTDPLLRRPLSILDADRDTGEFSVLLDVVGRGTRFLSHSQQGDVMDVMGPLGRPFEISAKTRRALLIGGGIGVVPLVFLARQAAERDVEVILVTGYRTADKVLPAERVPVEAEYVVATDDGTMGRRGLVTQAAADYISWADEVFACGPMAMLAAVSRMPFDRKVPVYVSLEEHMGCAMGVCLGCVVRTRHGYQRVCRDGPVFRADEVRWQH